MFSIVFLELKSLTKISDNKVSKDWNIGFTVVLVTFLYYLLNYLPFLITVAAASNAQREN